MHYSQYMPSQQLVFGITIHVLLTAFAASSTRNRNTCLLTVTEGECYNTGHDTAGCYNTTDVLHVQSNAAVRRLDEARGIKSW